MFTIQTEITFKVYALWKVNQVKQLGLSDPDIAGMVWKVGGGHPSANTIRWGSASQVLQTGWVDRQRQTDR